MIIIILFLFLFLIIFILFYCCDTFSAPNNNKIYSKNELINILLKDSDSYVNSFNNNDFMARNVNNKKEYNNSIINSCININQKLKNIIIKQIQIANSKFESYNIIGFDGKKCNTIPWNIGIVDGTQYENGYPHTRNNIIIIPKSIINNNLHSTLIHEKVHVYQKIYTNDILLYLNHNNFTKINTHTNRNASEDVMLFSGAQAKDTNLINRANPDIDNNIYQDKNNNILYCIYNNNPKSISDVNCSYSEHPFEFMAYFIQNNI